MPAWMSRCRIVARVTDKIDASFCTVDWAAGGGLHVEMELESKLDALGRHPQIDSQVAYVLLAHHLGAPPPRWAEMAVMTLTDAAAREPLAKRLKEADQAEKLFGLEKLFGMKSYGDSFQDFEAMQCQSDSVARFLVRAFDRPTLVAFAKRGKERGWDEAVRHVYGFKSVDDLERVWRKSLKAGK